MGASVNPSEAVPIQPPPHPWCIDHCHALWMLDILQAHYYNKALEIGPYVGYSSLVFLEACKNGFVKEFHTCDVQIQPNMRLLLDAHPSIKFHLMDDLELLPQLTPGDFEFVFVDGNHYMPHVQQETHLLLNLRPLVVMAHDTNLAAVGHPKFSGPSYLKWRFMTAPGYFCLEDALARHHQATARGMFFATTSLEIYEAAQASLVKWGVP